MVDVLDWAGADTVEAEELAVIPGLDEVFALADIKTFATSGDYDVVVVDCAPTAETIRLLSLPDVLGWYMERVFETQRRLTRIARPLLRPGHRTCRSRATNVFGAVRAFYDRLDGVRELLTDGDITSARLVVNPERLVVAEARRTFTYLSLFGYHVDAVIANRMLPDASRPSVVRRSGRRRRPRISTMITDAFAPLPMLTAELAGTSSSVTTSCRSSRRRCTAHVDPMAPLADLEPLRVEAVGDTLVLSLHLPFTRQRRGRAGPHRPRAVLTVGPHRRALVLPDSLFGARSRARAFVGDRLEVEFV